MNSWSSRWMYSGDGGPTPFSPNVTTAGNEPLRNFGSIFGSGWPGSSRVVPTLLLEEKRGGRHESPAPYPCSLPTNKNYAPGCAAPATAAPVKPGPTTPGASCTPFRLMMNVPPAPLVCTSMVVAALFALENTGISGVLNASGSCSNQLLVSSRSVGSAGEPS